MISIEQIIKEITEDDFTVRDGQAEITRDFALKMFSAFNLSHETKLEATREINARDTLYVVKARLMGGGKSVEELGSCSISEVIEMRIEGGEKDVTTKRADHDAIAWAATRAFKRALEMYVGRAFINQIIEARFGHMVPTVTREGVPGNGKRITPRELEKLLTNTGTVSRLQDVWQKHMSALLGFSTKDKTHLTGVKNNRKKQLNSNRKARSPR